jgi:large subunit ribosomal protein L7/L12
MFVPLPIVIVVGFTLLLMVGLIIRRRSERDPLLGSLPPAVGSKQALPRNDSPSAPFAELPPETEAQVRLLIAAGRKIDAIKLTRDTTRLGLKECKDLVDALG